MNAIHPNEFQHDPATQWPNPDLSLINSDRTPAPTMSDDEFQLVFGAWSDWLKSAAEVKGTHVDYVALALLTTASAIIGNTRWAVPWDGWKEPPVLWGVLIGDPSAGKSPALDAVLDPLKEIDRELTQAYEQERKEWLDKDEVAGLVLSQWKADAKRALADGGEPADKPQDACAGKAPIRKRVRITDATTEKVAELLAATWRGLLLSRDELSGWLGSMDRYSGGGDRPFWLEAYGGRSYTVDRKANPEPVTVEHLSVAILGGTQPDKLESLLLNSDDDGLLARFLTVFPDPVPLARPSCRLDEATPIAAFRQLLALQPATDESGTKRPFFIHLDEAAQVALQEFRQQCRAWEGEASGLMKGHVGKLPGLAVRVSLVLTCLDAAITGDGMAHEINASHIGRACHYVGEHLRSHAHRAYGSIKPAPEMQGARTIAEIIESEGVETFKVRDIQNRGRKHLGTTKAVKQALEVLISFDWIREERGNSGGRPSISYTVNPRIAGAI